MTENAEARLVCPNHGDSTVYLEEMPGDDGRVYCPSCGYDCQNFIKYPVAQVTDLRTGELSYRNVLTGEKV